MRISAMRDRRSPFPHRARLFGGRGRLAILAFAMHVVALAPGRVRAQDTLGFAAAVQQLVAVPDAETSQSRLVSYRGALRQLYERNEAAPLWTLDGRPTRQALESIDLFRRVESLGLRPGDYDPELLAERARTLADAAVRGRVAGAMELAQFDVMLSRSVLRLLVHLSVGRVDPRSLGFALPKPDEIDVASLAYQVSRASDVQLAFSAAEPHYAGYVALEQMLGRYRTLAADSTLRAPLRPKTSVRPGDVYTDATALRRLLVALGDLVPGTASADARRYTPELVEAVKAFQRRHGLDPDGVLGPATLTQLRVPLALRVRQIELTLERWRWLPHRPPPRYLAVNIPAFRLYAFEDDSTAAHPVLTMKVILGQAQGRHGTPVFVGTMREVVFRPYWDVPPNIARKELIPLIRRQPGYFSREALEIVRGSDDNAVIYPPTAANLARVASGAVRLRQRPGPNNALGLVKFVFPNAHNVYLHGTPAQELFARTRRDFSHGCIRVEEPATLAELVLRGQPGWDSTAIAQAMNGTRTQRVTIGRPVEVFILYATAVVGKDGTISFYPDLYGHDAALVNALERLWERRAVAAWEKVRLNERRGDGPIARPEMLSRTAIRRGAGVTN
jgi:murein L,D-transpeptidase YcbB/YkuD